MATASEIIDSARTFSGQAYTQAQTLVNQATSAIQQLGLPIIVTGPSFSESPAVDITTDVPEFQGIIFNAVAEPDKPADLQNLPTLSIGIIPTSTAVNPGFTEPPRPSQLHSFTTAAPSINTTFTFPTAPGELQSINIIAPTLEDRTAPTKPDIQFPVFGAVAPTDDITPPTDYAERFEASYRGIAPTMMSVLDVQMDTLISRYNPRYLEQMGRLEDRLASYIEGGNALTPAIENAIVNRTRDKVNAEYKRTRSTAYQDAARRGLTLPDGALASAVAQARQAGADNNSRAAIDVAVKQAELEQQNIQFAITTSASLRTAVMGAAINYHGSLVGLNGQALEYAKSVLGAMIEVYNTLVKAFELKLDIYKTEAAVYETRLRGVTALVEIYKAEISALEALTHVDLAKVEIYKGRLEALNILATVYQSQINVVLGQASLEKMKLELFGQQVQAYATEAQAKSSEWQGYTAAVQGQEAKLHAYSEQLHGDTVKIEAYKAGIEAKQAEINSITQYNQGILAQYREQVEGYKALTDARSRVATTQIELQRTQLTAFQAKMSAEEAKARITQQYYVTKATIQQGNFNSIINFATQNAKIQTESIGMISSVSLAGAQVYGNIAASALNAQNTLITKNESNT